MIIDLLLKYKERVFISVEDRVYFYSDAIEEYKRIENSLEQDFDKTNIVALDGDIGFNYIVMLFYLFDHNKVVVPLSRDLQSEKVREISCAETLVMIHSGIYTISNISKYQYSNAVINGLLDTNHPGVILFSSGTTEEPKAILHDMFSFQKKYIHLEQRDDIFLSLLLLTHIGGLNTLLYSLYTGAMLVLTTNTSSGNICRLIEKFKVTILPATPSFLNLLLLKGDHKNYDLSSLRTISYGTEVMPELTLHKIHDLFPTIKIKQTYGLSETGIFSSKSFSDNSVLIKINKQVCPYKIKDGVLYVKSPQSMIGYINAPSPFDEEGWFNTQDVVEEYEEGYLKILGRKTDIINIAGNKVYPAYIENILHGCPYVEDVSISKSIHPVLGQYIVATVKIQSGVDWADFRKIFFGFCADNLEKYQIPQKLIIVESVLYNARLKKRR